MNLPLRKPEMAADQSGSASVTVLPLLPKRTPLAVQLVRVARNLVVRLIPPAVVLALLLLVWELACRKAGATLPPPSKVVSSTWDLISDPFFDHGGLDKGLFWHLSASL